MMWGSSWRWMLMEVTWRWDESFVSRSGWMFVNLFAEVFWRI
jgi:hypothetical protein